MRSLAFFGFAAFPATVGAGLGIPATAAGAAVGGVGMPFRGVMWATSGQTRVPPDALNRTDAYNAYDTAGSLAMVPVGRGLAGPAATALGADQVLLVAAAISLVVPTALLAVPAMREPVRTDAQPTAPATPVVRKRPCPGRR